MQQTGISTTKHANANAKISQSAQLGTATKCTGTTKDVNVSVCPKFALEQQTTLFKYTTKTIASVNVLN